MESLVEYACVALLLAFGILVLPELGHRIGIRRMPQDAEGDMTHTITLTILPGATE
jgi:hypothetical protein